MTTTLLILSILAGIAILLLLILVFKIHAFIAFCFYSSCFGKNTSRLSNRSHDYCAGLVAPIIASLHLNSMQIAAIVIAIASGATTLSHLNDSGFWLICEYLGMDEKQTFRSWTMMTVILSLTGFATISLIYLFL